VAGMTEPLIEFKNVGKRFGNRTIMDQVNLKIYEGEITTIIGKSGSGKSVLLKHLIGLLKPWSDQLHVSKQRPVRFVVGI
jgi:phospholipid/cholesterol/gamma-HCH transport system ATP-binding protein